MWRHKLGEVENECASHIFGSFPIFLPKIIKIGGNLTKFWQKQICLVFLGTRCIQILHVCLSVSADAHHFCLFHIDLHTRFLREFIQIIHNIMTLKPGWGTFYTTQPRNRPELFIPQLHGQIRQVRQSKHNQQLQNKSKSFLSQTWIFYDQWSETTLCLKNRTPETFHYNFAKNALISIKIGTHNLHMT